MQKTMSSQNRRSTKQFTLTKTMLVTSAIISMLSLSACQTVPTTPTATSTQTSSTAATPTTTVTQAPVVDDYDYPIEPYVPPQQSTVPNPSTEQKPISALPSTVITTPSYDDYIIVQPPISQPIPQTAPPSHN